MDKDKQSAREPARDVEVFEQTTNTMQSQEERAESALLRRQEPDPALSKPAAYINDAADDQDGLDEAIDDQQGTPAIANPKESKSELIIGLAKGFATFFHTPDGDAFASITVNNHIENVRVRSHDFKRWLGMIHYKESRGTPGAQAVKDATDILEAEGMYDGPEIPMHIRYAEHAGSIYIDLCNDSWDQVQVMKDGWKVIGSKDSPVKFYRAQGMAALPLPSREGSIDLLRQFLNIENDSDWVMIVSWLIASMRPDRPFTVLVLQGEQGTAKSTTARLLRDLIDPSTVPSQSVPRSEWDLVIAASKSWVLNYDNLSYLSPTMSDSFCRVSTGGGFRTRALYTDDNERLFNSIRPIIMNGISDFASRHDLADRSLIVQLPPIPKKKRVSEDELMMYWDLTRDKLFGGLCNALSVALANIGSAKLPYRHRMADFASWATAAEPAFGWEHGTFIRAYENNQRRLVDIAIEADIVAVEIVRLIQSHRDHEWTGTATELLRQTESLNPELSFLKIWPKQANVFSGKLRRAAAALREKGIEIEWIKSGDRVIHIYRNDNYVPESLDHIAPENKAGECEATSAQYAEKAATPVDSWSDRHLNDEIT